MAKQGGIELLVNVDYLLKRINEAVDEINKSEKRKRLKLGVDTDALVSSIKKSIQEINNSGRLDNKPLKLSASEAKLRDSIKSAITAINKSGLLDDHKINLSATFDFKDVTEKLKREITVMSAKSGSIDIGSSGGDSLQKSVANVREELEREGERLKENNDFLRERVTLFTKSGDVKSSLKFGDVGENTVISATNGAVTAITKTKDNARITAEQNKATAAINQTRNALDELRAKYEDENSPKSIKKDTENFRELENEYENIIQLIKEFGNTDNKNTAQFKTNVDDRIAKFELMIDKFQREEYSATSLRTKDVATSAKIEAHKLDEFIAKIKTSNVPMEKMQGTIDSLKLSLSKVTDSASLTKFLNEFSVAKSEFGALKAESKALSTELAQVDTVSKQLSASIKTIFNQSNQSIFLKNGSNENVAELQKQLADLALNYSKLQESLENDTSTENVEQVKLKAESLQKQLQKLLTVSNDLKHSFANYKIEDDLIVKADKLLAKISTFEKNNSKAMNVLNPNTGLTFGAEINQIKSAVPTVQDLGTLDAFNRKFIVIESQIKATGKTGRTFFEEMRDKGEKFIKWTTVTSIIMQAKHYLEQMIKTVYDLDTALLDLKKTFKGSNTELEDFYGKSNKLAKQLGLTTEEILKTASAWSRFGFATNEAMQKMVEMSAMFAAISPDMDAETAQNGLVSIMKAFDIDSEDTLDGILSKVNIIGNTAATSNGEIVEMLQKSSAAMKVANNTLEQTIALETSAVEITRDAPGVGTAFKTISARLRSLDEETLQVTGDIEELTGKFADATKTVNSPNGISLFTDANKGTYKSTYQIFKELSEIWDDLSDRQTAQLGEILGGKRQLQVVSATIENFKAAEKALDDMANSAGSAEQEFAIYQETAEYSLNRMKETFTSIAQNAVDRDDLKNLIDIGTGLLEVVNGIVGGLGAMPTILGTIFGIIATNSKTLLSFNQSTNKFSFMGADIDKDWLSNLKANQAELKATINLVNQLKTSFDGTTLSQEMLNKVSASTDNGLKALVSDFNSGKISAADFSTGLNQISANLKTSSTRITALKAGIKSLGAAMGNIALGMAAALVVNTVIQAVDNAIHSIENNIQKIKDLNDEIESLKSEAEELNKQLSKTKLRINELEKLPKLTLLQEEELETLKAYNDELERQRRIAENQAKADKAEANSKAQATWKKMNGHNVTGAAGLYGIYKNDFFVGQKHQLEDYEKILKEIEKIENSDAYKKDPSKFDNTITKKKEELAELESKIATSYGKWNEVIKGLDPDLAANLDAINQLQAVIDKWDILSGKVKTTFQDIYNDSQFAVVKQYLDDLAKKGKLTVEVFNNLSETDVEGIDAFREALKNVENSTAEKVVEAITEAVKDSEDAANGAGKAYKDLAETFEKLYDAIDDVLSKQEQLADGFKKIQLGASLTAEEIYKLIKEMPALAKYIKETADGGFTITAEGFKTVNEENRKAVEEQAQKDLENVREQIELLKEKERLEEEKEKLREEKENIEKAHGGKVIPNTLPSYDKAVENYEEACKQFEELYKQCQDITSPIEELEAAEESLLLVTDLLNESFDETKIAIEGLNEAYSNAKSEISGFNNDIKTIDSAIKKLKEGATLGYDEMMALIEISSELEGRFEPMSNGFYIVTDALEDLREQSYKTRNDYIDDLIAETKAEIEATEASKKAYQDTMNAMIANGAASALPLMFESLGDSVEDAEEKIKVLYDTINKLSGWKNELLDGESNDNDLSKELQNQIDSYKTILSAVELVKDKYSDSIGKEIDALKDIKDALKDNNDERQRELDLIEARNNLENAKKRKVWVFTDDGGFQQVQDEGAVKEAEEKYRDVITDIQEAEIDKQIEALEKQQEALEENTKALTELEQNIQDAMAIEQAKEILGLVNDVDLLNLSEEEKQKIITGLADAMNRKDIEDNKDNPEYKSVTTDNILKSLGATVTMADIGEDLIKSFTTSLGETVGKMYADNLSGVADNITNVTNNNGGTTITNTFNIYESNDIEKTKKVIIDTLNEVFIQVGNSIK